MRVQHLYIIGWANNFDAEVDGVCRGLFEKHRGTATSIAYVLATVPENSEVPSTLELKLQLGAPSLCSTVGQREPVTVEKSAAAPATSRQGGVYVVSHGGRNLSGTKAAIPVGLLSRVVPDAIKIDKIVLLGCSLAARTAEQAEADLKATIDASADLKQLSFMVAFVKLLAMKSIKPIVAGYDEYVSAFPASVPAPTPAPAAAASAPAAAAPAAAATPLQHLAKTTIYTPESSRKQSDKTKRVEAARVPGRKVVELKRVDTDSVTTKVTVDAAYRRQHKKFYRVEGDKILHSSHPAAVGIDFSEEWTDKKDKK